MSEESFVNSESTLIPDFLEIPVQSPPEVIGVV